MINVKTQLDVADLLMNAKFVPFVPLYSHFQHMAHPRPYQDWIKLDLDWIPSCDCILRLKGESSGADGEVEFAKDQGIPVFYVADSVEETIQDIRKYFDDEFLRTINNLI